MGNCASAPAPHDDSAAQQAKRDSQRPMVCSAAAVHSTRDTQLGHIHDTLPRVQVTGQKLPEQQPVQAPRHTGSGKLISLQSASSLQANLENSKTDGNVPPAAPAVDANSAQKPTAADAQPSPPPDRNDARRSFEQSHKVGLSLPLLAHACCTTLSSW